MFIFEVIHNFYWILWEDVRFLQSLFFYYKYNNKNTIDFLDWIIYSNIFKEIDICYFYFIG